MEILAGLEPRAARVSDEYSIPTELIAHTCHKERSALSAGGFLMTTCSCTCNRCRSISDKSFAESVSDR